MATQQPLDQQKIVLCLQYIHNPPSEQQRKEANTFLMDSERHPEFPVMMLQVFQQFQGDQGLKMCAFLYLKNSIQRYWKSAKKFKNTVISDESKNIVREQFIQLLNSNQDKGFRKHLNSSICYIVQNDFPNHYQQLYDYITSTLQKIEQEVKNGNLAVLVDSQTHNFFNTVKLVLREQAKKRLGGTRVMFENIIQTIMQSVIVIWDNVYNGLNNSFNGNNQQEIEGYLKLAKTLDKVLISTVLCSCNQSKVEEIVSQIIVKFLVKCSKLLEFRRKSKDEDILELVSKKLKVIVHGLSNIQSSFPFAFTTTLNDYLQLINIIITQTNNEEEDIVLKAGLLSLIKVLKTFLYYSPSQQYIMTVQQKDQEKYAPLQIKLHQTFNEFFTNQNVQNILETFITKLFPRVISNALTEEVIEQEDETYLDLTMDEMDNSMYNILMATTDNILQRLPQVALQLIKQLLDTLINSGFQQFNVQVQEGIYAMVGLIPKIAEKNQIEANQIVNIFQILEHLYNNKENNENFARRIPILINRWLDNLDSQNIQKVFEIVFQILNSSNSAVVKYECCMCIKNLIKTDKFELNYNDLIDKIAPVIVQLFQSFQASSILWPLVYLLSSLLEKSMYSASNNVLQSFQTTDLQNLIKTDSELLKNAFVDMFKNLIVSFPPNSPISNIVSLIISFIQHSISKSIEEKQGVDQTMLSLWYVLAKEYSPQQHQQDEQMKQLIYAYIPFISNDDETDGQIISDSLYILEEYVLLNFIPISEYGNIIELIEKKYKFANEIRDQNEQIVLKAQQQGETVPYLNSEDKEIKSACLNITATLLLIYLNSGQTDAITQFNKILDLCVRDLAAQFDATKRGVGSWRVGIQAFINRFLTKFPNELLQYVNSLGVTNDQFFECWIQNMSNLSSKNSLKINTVTVLNMLPLMSDNVIKIYFVQICKKILPDIAIFLDYQNNPQYQQQDDEKKNKNKLIFGKRRMTDGEPSERKSQLRQTQLFNDVNLHQLFKTTFQEIFTKFGINEQALQQLFSDENDQGYYQQLITLLKQ